MLLGLGIFGNALNDFRVAVESFGGPLEVKLHDIENGLIPTSKHIRLDEHYRLYASGVYRYSLERNLEAPDLGRPLEYAYYRVYSLQSPFGQGVTALRERYGGYEKLTHELSVEEWPPTEGVGVIIKTTKYYWEEQFPGGLERALGISGIVINKRSPVRSKEKVMLQKNFGKIDFDKVLVLEEGGKPVSLAESMPMMALGAVLFLGPVFLIMRARVRKAKQGGPMKEAGGIALPTTPIKAPKKSLQTDSLEAPTDSDNNPYRGAD